jgi:hypothetical protein
MTKAQLGERGSELRVAAQRPRGTASVVFRQLGTSFASGTEVLLCSSAQGAG